MGVRTKSWGPCAWRTLEVLARAYDRLPPAQQPFDALHSFLQLLGLVLPCSYCRNSYIGFIYDPRCRCTNIETVVQTQGALRLVFNLHNRVSRKLHRQAVEAAGGDDQQREEAERHWASRFPSWVQVQQRVEALPPLASRDTWLNLTKFLAYIVCDYPTEPTEGARRTRFFIARFGHTVGALLTALGWAPAGAALTKVFDPQRQFLQPTQNAKQRVTRIYKLYTLLFKDQNAQQPWINEVLSAIVGHCG